MTSLFNQNRPYHWDQFKGQEIPITYLRNRVRDNKHPNAILLYGDPGVGKSSLAFLYAKSVLDPSRVASEDCISGEEAYKRDYSNITYHLVRDSSSTKESLDYLTSIALAKPMGWEGMREDQYRRFIILDEVELIHSTTFSYLLNPLEYSPSTTTWILISMDPSKLNPIVRSAIESRCKELRLKPLRDEDIADLINIDDRKLALFIAKCSNGNARKAWSILEVLEGANAMSLDKAESYLLGSATSANRRLFIKSCLQGDYDTAISLCKDWDRESVGSALLSDIALLKTSINLIPLVTEIKLWMSSPNPYPLSAVVRLLTESSKPPDLVPATTNSDLGIVKEYNPSPTSNKSIKVWLDNAIHN